MKKQKSVKKSWFKSRGYIHLTGKINPKEDKARIFGFVKNPRCVEKHAFFPLLHKKIVQRRFKVIGNFENGKAKRGHSDKGKPSKKLRPLHYATHIDSQIYAYYSNEIIQKKYETLLRQNPELSKCITAYRRIPIQEGTQSPCKSNIHFAKEVFEYIKNRGECCAMAFDISSFFNNLNHKQLKKAWCELLGKKSLPKDHYNIFKSITNYSYILLDELRKGKRNTFDERQLAENRKNGVQAFFSSPKALREAINAGEIRVYKNQYKDKDGNGKIRGIPQGLPISAMLANLYLLAFDQTVFQKISDIGGLYRRYSDDIIVICDEEQREEISDFVVREIKKYNLEIQKAKTEVSFFRYVDVEGEPILNVYSLREKIVDGQKVEKEQEGYPFGYLGFDFYGHKTLLKSKNLAKFYRRMKEAVKSKAKRIERVKAKYLIEGTPPIFKRKLYRVYSHKGINPRRWKKKVVFLKRDELSGNYVFKGKEIDNVYRGNYLNYVQRASKIMDEPAILLQMKRSSKILRNYMKRKIRT